MKYFTKEWYELCQKIDSHLLLQKDKQAELFSEEFFHELYNEKLTEFLDVWKEVSAISDEPFDKEKIIKEFNESFLYNKEHIKKILPKEILNNIADIDEMQFENYKVIKQEGVLKNSRWLYDEIYKINDKYELHVLLENKNNELVEFIVSAENISFKHNLENKSEFC